MKKVNKHTHLTGFEYMSLGMIVLALYKQKSEDFSGRIKQFMTTIPLVSRKVANVSKQFRIRITACFHNLEALTLA